MIIGTAAKLNIKINNNAEAISAYRNKFSEILYDLNFSDINGISATSNALIPKVNRNRKKGFKIYELMKTLSPARIIGREAIKSPFAGVGNPIKFSDCRVSILNLARRKAENTAIKKADQLRYWLTESIWGACRNNW